MNLRLSRDSIRIRVESREAFELLDRGLIVESLPLMDRNLELRIETTDQRVLRFEELSGNGGMRLLVPQVDLEQLVVNHENRSSKSGLELRVSAVLRDRDVDVCFEIDRFLPKSKK